MHNLFFVASFQDVLTFLQHVIALVAVIVAAAFFVFVYFVSPILVLFVFCDAQAVFLYISRRSNKYVASFVLLGCVVWLIYWYYHLTPVIAQLISHERGA
jgi:hypothetical protein